MPVPDRGPAADAGRIEPRRRPGLDGARQMDKRRRRPRLWGGVWASPGLVAGLVDGCASAADFVRHSLFSSASASRTRWRTSAGTAIARTPSLTSSDTGTPSRCAASRYRRCSASDKSTFSCFVRLTCTYVHARMSRRKLRRALHRNKARIPQNTNVVACGSSRPRLDERPAATRMASRRRRPGRPEPRRAPRGGRAAGGAAPADGAAQIAPLRGPAGRVWRSGGAAAPTLATGSRNGSRGRLGAVAATGASAQPSGRIG